MGNIFSILVLSFSFAALSKQIIICENPQVKVKFDESDVENRNTSSFSANYGSGAGESKYTSKVSEVIVTKKYITFSQDYFNFAETNISIPRNVIGVEADSFQALYSDFTPESSSPKHEIECSSTIE